MITNDELEFQKNILKYLIQYECTWLDYISPKIFDQKYSNPFQLIKGYIVKYKSLPDKANLKKFLSVQPITDKGEILNVIPTLYEPLYDVAIIEERILQEVRNRLFRSMLTDGFSVEGDISDSHLQNITKQLQAINSLSYRNNVEGILFWDNLDNFQYELSNPIYPTFSDTLNRLTKVGGFAAPEDICIMKPPKSFGTGLFLQFAYHYSLMGLDVFYADFENSTAKLNKRLKQAIVHKKVEEMSSVPLQHYSWIRELAQKTYDVGEILLKKYPKNVGTMHDIERDLKQFIAEGYNPKLMITDYVDRIGHPDKNLPEYKKITENVALQANINNEYNMFSITASTMTGDSWKKKWFTADNIGKARDKIFDFRRVFGLHIDGRLQPIVQDVGSSWQKEAVQFEIDKELFIIKDKGYVSESDVTDFELDSEVL